MIKNNRISVSYKASNLIKAAFWPSAITLAQTIVMTIPAYAVDATVASVSPAHGPAALASESVPGTSSLTAPPPTSITAAPPASGVRLEQSVQTTTVQGSTGQATIVPNVSAETISADIYNFDIVSSGLWRGSQPSHQAIAKLAKNGVKTIIDLRYAGSGCEEEALVAKQYGISYVNIPLGFENPSLSNVAKFLAIVAKPANQPVFVHCRQGADRTGTLVGVFRILHDHWSFTEAYNEMRLHHFKPWLGNLKSLVARCEVDPAISKELSEMASKLEETATLPKLSSKPQPDHI
jgi:protein tyrosine/serine phosphatase